MNETIEKIAKVIDDLLGITKTHCDVVKCENCEFGKSEYYCGDVRIAEAIYKQIVEPLEKEIEQRRDMMQRMNCNYVTEIYKSEELQHKVKVLERALSHLAHDFNGQQFYIYAQSDTDEETYEKFIQRAEKELELEKGE